MLERINEARAARGLPGLRWNGQLAEAALGHARDVAAHVVMTQDPARFHEGSDGSSIVERLRRAGYAPFVWREVTGWGFGGSWEQMVGWWLNSPSHWPILFSVEVDEAGVGYVYAPGSAWVHYWVVDFGKRKGGGCEEAEEEPAGEVYVPVVVGGNGGAVDLLAYIRGDGRMYEVRHGDGATETFQTILGADGRFYQGKNSQWEEFWADDDFIWRGVDTSPGGGRAYIQFEPGMRGARWCRRRMAVGDSWEGPGHLVQFRMKGDCSESALNSGPARNRCTLFGRFESMRFGDVVVEDVVGLSTATGEKMFFGRGWGLVAWSSAWGRSEVVAVYGRGERPDLRREDVRCFE